MHRYTLCLNIAKAIYMIYLEKIITTYNLERNKLRKNNNNLIFIQVGKRNIYSM